MNRTSNRDASSRNNQNRQRNRGRNNSNSNNSGGGNRRGPNPLQRSYESNGPEVKIRGNAMQVAEKYLTLARDAQVAGDRILAENYMQHAEHYSRIIAAAQAATQQQQQVQQAQQEQQGQQNPQSQPNQQNEQVEEEPSVSGSGPQPVVSPGDNIGVEGVPAVAETAQQPNATADIADASASNTTDGKPDQPKPARGRRRRPEPAAQPVEPAAMPVEAATPDAEQVEVVVEEKPPRKPRTRRPRAAAKPAADVVEIAEPVQPEAAE